MSGVTSAVMTFIIISLLYPIINAVPMAGLTGVMFVICIHCFDWSSLQKIAASLLPKKTREAYQFHHKINRMDAAIVIVVTIVTPFTDLAIAVTIGCFMAMIGFAWESGDRLSVEESYVNSNNGDRLKVCTVHGSLYFASVEKFLSYFQVDSDPEIVEVRMAGADICDYSAMQCLNTLGDDYKKQKKVLKLVSLRHRSARVLHKGISLMHTFSKNLGEENRESDSLAFDLDTGVTILGGADKLNMEKTTQYHTENEERDA